MDINPYDLASPYYDLILGNRGDEVIFINAQMDLYKVEMGRLLDLGIGTGAITSELSTRFRMVTGVDSSKEMLKLASNKTNNKIKTVQSDISSYYDSKIKYNVIICTMDTINHLKNIDEWGNVFKNTSKMLEDNGIFIFDMNTVSRLDALSSVGIDNVETDAGIYKLNVAKKGDYKFSFNINLETKGESSEWKIDEVSYPIDQVNKELSKYFRKIDVYEKIEGEFVKTDNDTAEKLFIVCSNKNPNTY